MADLTFSCWQFPEDIRKLGSHPGTKEEREKWSESTEPERRQVRAKLPLISELYHIEKIPQILELQLRLYSHGRSFCNSTDDAHADQIADRLVTLILALETYETRKVEKARQKQKQQEKNTEVVRNERVKAAMEEEGLTEEEFEFDSLLTF